MGDPEIPLTIPAIPPRPGPQQPPQPLPEKPLVGTSVRGVGVLGQSNSGAGVSGQSSGNGVEGMGHNGVSGVGESGGAGVLGVSVGTGPGVLGKSQSGASEGVFGQGRNGVHGESASATDSGVWGNNTGGGVGVSGSTTSTKAQSGAVYGINSGSGAGAYGLSKSGAGIYGSVTTDAPPDLTKFQGKAGYFQGDVWITGSVTALGDCQVNTLTALGDFHLNGNLNIASQGDVILSDCAEYFDASEATTVPGTVMVIDQDGVLRPSDHPYDKKVAGVVSGAGNFKPGIILGEHSSQEKGMLIALLGKVFCKVDAQYSPVEVGDLLTTSPTPGHAMKVEDHDRAFGCVIGKALRKLDKGQGLIPILIALQ